MYLLSAGSIKADASSGTTLFIALFKYTESRGGTATLPNWREWWFKKIYIKGRL